MKQSQSRLVGLASLLLMVSASFVACGGLDPRKVSRGSDDSSAGDDNNGGGTAPSAGGSESGGGEPNVNPFGGAFDLGGAPPIVDGPPKVEQVDPADADDSADPNDTVSLLFNEAVNPDTVSIDSVKLFDGDVEVDGDVTLTQSVFGAFEPARRLSLLTSYDVNVSTAITDVDGTPMEEPFTSSFTVRDGEWSEQLSIIDDQTTWGSEQDIGADGRGNMLAVWTSVADPTTGIRTVVASWYRPTSGWQPPVPLEDSVNNASGPRVAVSPEGDAIVAWFVNDASQNYRVHARRYLNGGWEATAQDVAPMSTDPFNSGSSPLAVAIGGGQTVVAWFRMQYVPDPYTYYYTLSLTSASLDGAWPEHPTQNYGAVSTAPNYESLRGLAATVDAKGNALATFYHDAVSTDPLYGSGVYYTRKAVAGAWQYPAKIPGTLKIEGGPHLASDGDGSMAVWTTYDAVTQQYALLASRYTKAKQFVAGVPINDADLGGAINLGQRSIAGNASSFFAAWTQRVGRSENAYVSRFDIASNMWDTLPTPISDGVASVGYQASVGVDNHGHALVAFEQEVDQNQTGIMAARYNANSGEWTLPEAPLSLDDNAYDAPLVAVGGNGVAAVLFGANGRDGQFPRLGGQYCIFK